MGSSSPTRDKTCAPCSGRRILNHWTTREVPTAHILNHGAWFTLGWWGAGLRIPLSLTGLRVAFKQWSEVIRPYLVALFLGTASGLEVQILRLLG